MTWREELRKFLTEKKYYRLDHLNRKLTEICTAWIDLINEFDGLTAELNPQIYKYNEIEIKCSHIKISFSRGKPQYKAYLGYFSNENKELCLFICTAIMHDLISGLKLAHDKGLNLKRGDIEDDIFYKWDEHKEMNGSDIYEPDFVLDQLNRRYMNYHNRVKN